MRNRVRVRVKGVINLSSHTGQQHSDASQDEIAGNDNNRSCNDQACCESRVETTPQLPSGERTR
jgi:hypothetical protein